jgi:galactokinase
VSGPVVRAFAPGRVNLIGDHTDYTGGLVLPMAVQLGTTVTGTPGGTEVRLRSDAAAGEAVVALDVADPAAATPPWARYVAGVVCVVRPRTGFTGRVTTTLPVGAGLSSSAALEVAVALALGFTGTHLELALACQRAEHAASGVPCGVMDQLASAAGVEGCALLIDCTTLVVEPVPLPEGVEVVAVHSGERRALDRSAYATRRAECEAAAAVVGPLRDASVGDLAAIGDPVVRARARHVVTENARVRAFAEALQRGDAVTAGALMVESHRSLRDDFAVSTPTLDALVERLRATPGVFGARLTGAGFGGCVVALCEPGAIAEGWRLRPAAGARRELC